MQGQRLLQSIRLHNLLSYGASSETYALEPLNVLIGPNASGKSNLIEALSLLRATPSNLLAPIREGGGVTEWLWKGDMTAPAAEIDVTLSYPEGVMALRYHLAFTVEAQRLKVVDESIENEKPYTGHTQPYFFYRYQQGNPALNVRTRPEAQPGTNNKREPRALRREQVSPEQSILSQRRDADTYPELTYIGEQFGRIAFFREWNLGRYTPPRLPQKVDLPEDFLLEDASNLGLVLNDLQNRPGVERTLLENLRNLSERFEKISTKVQGGTIQVFLHERGLKHPVPATRLSDGTLRYLCLLTVLCHPTPPPLVCIEEPELGLHPDVLPTVGRLLIEASSRTQLIVTTHSETLVSALSEVPEAVTICEYDEVQGTVLRRLAPQALAEWLERYRLGELWRMGELGGTL